MDWQEELPESTRDDTVLWAYVYKNYKNPNKSRMGLPSGDFGKKRDDYKKYIGTLVTLDRPFFSDDPDYQTLLNDIESYSKMRADANFGDYDAETKLVKKIVADIELANEKLQKEADNLGIEYRKIPYFDSEDDLNDEQKQKYRELTEKDNAIEKMTRICADFQSFFASQQMGTLNVPNFDYYNPEQKKNPAQNRAGNLQMPGKEKTAGEDYVYINASDINPKNTFGFSRKKELKDAPLFPHEPCISDISQGYLGDCYLLSALSYIAENNPEKIRDMIRDNGDGTCTVRLFCGKLNSDPKPLYVRVEKSISGGTIGIGQAEDCLWVQMIEKAYVLSGLHMDYQLHDFNIYNKDSELIPFDKATDTDVKSDEQLENPKYSDEQKKKMAPWLYDEKGNRKEYIRDYRQIEGGKSHIMTEILLGKGYVGEQISLPNVKYTYEFYDNINDEIPSLKKMLTDMFRLTKCEQKDIKGEGTDRHVDINSKFTPSIGNIVIDNLENNIIVNDNDRIKLFFKKHQQAEFIDRLCEKVLGKDGIKFTKPSPNFDENFKKSLKDSFNAEFEEAIKKVKKYEEEAARNAQNNEEENDSFDENDDDTFSVKEEKAKNIYMPVPFSEVPLSEAELTNIKAQINTLIDDFCLKFNQPYTQKEIDFVLDIKKNIQNGRYIFSGTSAAEGLITETHAYSIHDTKQMDDGRLMLQVRNPWGTTSGNSVIYEEKNGKFIPKAGKSENGIFWMELRDYLKEFSDMYMCGPVDEKSGKLMGVLQGQEVAEFGMKIDAIEILTDIKNALTATEVSGIPEIPAYKQLKKEIIKVSQNLSKEENNSAVQILNLLSPLDNLCETYIRERNLYNRSNDTGDRLLQVMNLRRLKAAVNRNALNILPENMVSVKETYLELKASDSFIVEPAKYENTEAAALNSLAVNAALKDNSSEEREKMITELEKFSTVLEDATHWYNSSSNYRNVQTSLDSAIGYIYRLDGEMSQRELQTLNELIRSTLADTEKYLKEKNVSADFVAKNEYEKRRVTAIRELNTLLGNKVRSMNSILSTKPSFKAALNQSLQEKSNEAYAKFHKICTDKKTSLADRKKQMAECLVSLAGPNLINSRQAGNHKEENIGLLEQAMLIYGEERVLRKLAASSPVQKLANDIISAKEITYTADTVKQEITKKIFEAVKSSQEALQGKAANQEVNRAERNAPNKENAKKM